MTKYSPVFPRTVAGLDWRTPLYHAELEALAARMDALYSLKQLPDGERAHLLRAYEGLAAVDVFTLRIADIWPTAPALHETDTRPAVPGGGCTLGARLDNDAGFVARVREFVGALERRHLPEVIDGDDI